MKSAQLVQVSVPIQYEPIVKLLLDLPAKWLTMVEQFIRFLTQNEPSSTSPTVATPASTLVDLIGIMPTDYHGNALTDSEALYE
jgi:hypothetical protein